MNEVVCHGIPDDRELLPGDIINIDVSVFANGCHGDTSKTFFVGESGKGGDGTGLDDSESRDIVDATEACLERGINVSGPGADFRDIGCAIEELAKERGYKVIRDYSGHGIGEAFHMLPFVHHYDTGGRTAMEMRPGMIFTIEPMLVPNSGTRRCGAFMFFMRSSLCHCPCLPFLSFPIPHHVLFTSNAPCSSTYSYALHFSRMNGTQSKRLTLFGAQLRTVILI